jgi:plastocyanin domain-containing protein
LIGLELWWFLLSKPKSRKAATQDGVQEITKNKTIAIRDLQSRE